MLAQKKRVLSIYYDEIHRADVSLSPVGTVVVYSVFLNVNMMKGFTARTRRSGTVPAQHGRDMERNFDFTYCSTTRARKNNCVSVKYVNYWKS